MPWLIAVRCTVCAASHARVRGFAAAVRVAQRAVDGDRGAPGVDFVTRGLALERTCDGVDVVGREPAEGVRELASWP